MLDGNPESGAPYLVPIDVDRQSFSVDDQPVRRGFDHRVFAFKRHDPGSAVQETMQAMRAKGDRAHVLAVLREQVNDVGIVDRTLGDRHRSTGSGNGEERRSVVDEKGHLS